MQALTEHYSGIFNNTLTPQEHHHLHNSSQMYYFKAIGIGRFMCCFEHYFVEYMALICNLCVISCVG